MTVSRFLAFTGLATGLAACSTAPDPELYALVPSQMTSSNGGDGPLIGLSEITLPAYARNPQITTAVSSTQIVENDNHRWAVPPNEALTVALAQALEGQTGGHVIQRPFPRGINPDIRLQVTFDRLLRSAGGGAEISGQYIVVGLDEDFEVERFQISVPPEGDGFGAYMAAISEGVDRLSQTISTDISTLSDP